MNQDAFVKPVLPKEFVEPSLVGTFVFIFYMLAMFILPGALAYLILTESSLPIAVGVLLCLPLFVLAGQGLHLMGWIGHDGLHFTLHQNRLVSACIGVFFSAGTVTFFEMGMALDHWTHHRYTNKPEDPDLRMFEKYKTFWSRLLFSRINSNRHYMRRVYRLITNKPLDEELTRIILPFNLETIRKLAWFNVACNIAWGCGYIAFAIYNIEAFIIMVAVPMLFAQAISGLRPYIEHNGTDHVEYRNTRTRNSLIWTFLDFGANYHFEHHLYPSVPQWRLPRLHRFLCENGFYGRHYDHTIFAHYKYATSQHQYPKAS